MMKKLIPFALVAMMYAFPVASGSATTSLYHKSTARHDMAKGSVLLVAAAAMLFAVRRRKDHVSIS